MYQRIASEYLSRLAGKSEKEVEKLLKVFLPGTPFAGAAKIVGGYVRDEYLKSIKEESGVEPDDLDVVVAPVEGYKGKGAETLTKLIHKEFPDRTTTPHNMGEDYPIWQIIFRNGDIEHKGETYATDGAKIEFADAMKETYPDPNSRQRKVEPATLEEDIERRDFTVNSLLKDLTTGEIEDLSGVSREDIKNGILRGHPKVSWDKMFSDDAVRMLRLIRFQVKYGWKIPKAMVRTVKRNADRIKIISSDRIKKELVKIAELGKMKQAIKFFSLTGLLKHILPEIEALKGVKQPPEHHGEGDVFRHTLRVLENTAPGVESQMAALLHDIGKPSTTKLIEDKLTSYDHDDVGAEIAHAIMKRLEFDKETQNRVKTMVKYHMRPHRLPDNPTSKALRRFIKDVGEELVDAVLDLAHADSLGRIPSKSDIPDLREKINQVQRYAPAPKKLVLDGNEVMDIIGMKGLAVGVANKMLEDRTLENPGLTKDEAEKFLRDHLEEIRKETDKELENQKKLKEDTARKKRDQAKKVASEFLSRQ